MKQYAFFFAMLVAGSLYAQKLTSPSGAITLDFHLNAEGAPLYSVTFKGRAVVNDSHLGIRLKDGGDPVSGFKGGDLTKGFRIESTNTSEFDESWKPVLGEQSSIRDHHKELRVALVQQADLHLVIVFRVFDDGVAFRYEFPKQAHLNHFITAGEATEFNLADDPKTFWIPGDFDSQEYVYNETRLSEIDNDKLNLNNGIGLKSIAGRYVVQAPLMMKTPNALYLNIFEAACINYPVMHLRVDPARHALSTQFAPSAAGDAAYLITPAVTPWRTIMVSDDARDIVGSKMVLNLNEPSKIDDTSWIKPMKFVGVWWEMHVGKSTWDYAGSQNAQNASSQAPIPTGRHGATTANTKRYIDFAAKYGFDGVLVEGWDIGWEDWFGNWKEEVFDFVTPYPDFDIKEVSAYAKAKGVKMIMHHETSGSVANYERRFDRAYAVMKEYGYPAVKTGYVGRIIPRGEFHDGQAMVNHFAWVAQRAAEYKVLIDSHESVRPTGLQRTWPNYIAAEAARGNEFNAWSVGNPPMHETLLPFTRLLGGPMDYTPGIFEIKMSVYDPKKTEAVHTTLAKQLALYVTMYSPLQMAADLPENYERYPDAFRFIREVALDWDETRWLEAEPGDYLTVVRKEKGGERWFLGAITDENARKTTLTLDFLPKGKKYRATIYEDAPDAHWDRNPKAYRIRTVEVTAKSKLNLVLAAGGGCAISFDPL